MTSTASNITDALNSYTSKPNGIPGAVFRVIKNDGTILYEGASGTKGLTDKGQPLTTDAIFWVASCTKLLTAVSALQLVEQGKIDLDDNAENYLPEIGEIKILTGFENGNPIFQEPKTKITIRHLLTHTSGMVYEIYNHSMKKITEINNTPFLFSTKRAALDYPLSFEPGTDWENGTGLDWVGLIIEKVTGQTLGAYMNQHIFTPLGIHSTTFVTNANQDACRANLHFRMPDGLPEIDPIIALGDKVEVHLGGAGIHSSAADFTTILQALLCGGEVNGNRILSNASVDLLFSEQYSPDENSLQKVHGRTTEELSKSVTFPTGVSKVWTFGGMKLNGDLHSGRSAGSVWWAGATNCYWWIDRAKGVTGVLFTQILPFHDMEVAECWATCEKLLYDGL